MPHRTRSHVIEDLSRDRIRQAFNRMGWTVEDLRKDYGEDLLVRIFDAGVATPLLFFVQCKGTDNIRKYASGDGPGVLFPVKRRHIEHWERFSEPVILSVCDSKADRAYWECVQSYLSSNCGMLALSKANDNKADEVRIPVTNPLDEVGLARIRSITRIRFERFEGERQGARTLIQILEERLNLRIEYDFRGGPVILTFPNEGTEFIFHGTILGQLLALDRTRVRGRDCVG
jgi:hypothetical protein